MTSRLDGAMFLVWGPPSHGPRSKVFARELGIDLNFVTVTQRRGLLVAPYKYFVQTVRTIGLLARRRPSLVMVQSPPSVAVLVVAAYCIVARADYIVDAHSAAMLSKWWTRPRWLNRILARRALATIVTNEHFAERLESDGAVALVLRDIPTRFPMGVPPDLEPGTHVLAVNTFNFDEPLAEVIAAARRLPDVTFHVTGRVEAHPEQVPADTPPNLRFTGYLADEDYFALMKDADAVMCLTTRNHTMQRGACEALSMGRPIITSDWPLLREYFHQGTIHVDNTALSIAEAVGSLKEEQPRLEKEIAEMRQWQLEQWRQARDRLTDLIEGPRRRRRSGSLA